MRLTIQHRKLKVKSEKRMVRPHHFAPTFRFRPIPSPDHFPQWMHRFERGEVTGHRSVARVRAVSRRVRVRLCSSVSRLMKRPAPRRLTAAVVVLCSAHHHTHNRFTTVFARSTISNFITLPLAPATTQQFAWTITLICSSNWHNIHRYTTLLQARVRSLICWLIDWWTRSTCCCCKGTGACVRASVCVNSYPAN